MSPQSIVCATCAATVPHGRLSCPACGELLASVAGAARARPVKTRAATGRAKGRSASAAVMDAPPVSGPSAPPQTVDSAPDLTVGAPDLAVSAPEPVGPAPEDAYPTYEVTGTATLGWDTPPGWDARGWDTPEPDGDSATNDVFDRPLEGPHAAASGQAAPGQAAPGQAAPGWEPPIFQPVADAPAPYAAVETDDTDVGADPAPAAARDESPMAWPAHLAAHDASPVAWPADQAMRAPSPEVARTAVPYRSVPDAPGAYVPPIIPAQPAGPPAPARAWAGQPAVDPGASDTGTGRSSIAGELFDATRVTEFVGWLAVAGSAMAAVGFLLPWGVSVIGASGVGYFDRWGLAGPFHFIVFLSLLGLLGLSLVRNPIPLWLRVGVPGLALGALLVGLTWPYLVGLSGTGPGAMVVAIGALVLAAAGIGALAIDRHANEDRPV